MARRTSNTAIADLTLFELIAEARRQLDDLEHQAAWRTSDLDGVRVDETVGGRSNVASDPTMGQALSASFIGKKLDKARTLLVSMVSTTLPSAYGALILEDERRRESDAHRTVGDRDVGPADLTGGVSAYRGDRKVTGRAREDLQSALDAQRRRLAQGRGFGDA